MFTFKQTAFGSPRAYRASHHLADDGEVFRPSRQQVEAVGLFKAGKSFKVSAFAGAGKTSTLKMMAEQHSGRGLYLAFNSKIAEEAQEKFPSTVECRTTHASAWKEIWPRFESMPKMTDQARIMQIAEAMALNEKQFGETLSLDARQQAFVIFKAVQSFCQSAEAGLTASHVQTHDMFAGQPAEAVDCAKDWLLGKAQIVWEQMCSKTSSLGLGHDGYLKLWSLEGPRVEADYVLLDEAQDTNAVVLDLLSKQDIQVVYVGDRHQQIYEWRGAVNAMSLIDTDIAYLTRSFRFGTATAGKATQVLKTLGEHREITHNEEVSRVGYEGEAPVLLARTNRTIMAEASKALSKGLRVHIVGGVDAYARQLEDVKRLKSNRRPESHEFYGLANWKQAEQLAEREEGESLRTFVQLVKNFGEDRLLHSLRANVNTEEEADIVLSTAHKSKGREWNEVKLADDFAFAGAVKDQEAAQARARLFYVAMTRAKKRLIVDERELSHFTEGRWKPRTYSWGDNARHRRW